MLSQCEILPFRRIHDCSSIKLGYVAGLGLSYYNLDAQEVIPLNAAAAVLLSEICWYSD